MKETASSRTSRPHERNPARTILSAGRDGVRGRPARPLRRPARTSCSRPGASATARRARPLDFLQETARDPRRPTGRSRRRGRTTPDRRVEITGPTDRKLVINALNSGAKGFMADFEDANSPTWRNQVERPREPDRRDRGHDHLRLRGRPALRARRPARDADRPPARLAPAREAPAGRRRADRRRASWTSGSSRSTAPGACSTAAAAPTSTCRRLEHHLEARLWNDVFIFTEERARAPARRDPRHGPDRDAARRVPDGGDPLRAARALLRPERGPLGLHLLDDQVLPGPPGVRAARPQRREDDGAVHARLHRAAGEDLPPARRVRDGRHGGADPVAQGRRGQRARDRGGARGQGARGRGRLRRHLGRAPRRGGRGVGRVRRRCSATSPTRSTSSARTSG